MSRSIAGLVAVLLTLAPAAAGAQGARSAAPPPPTPALAVSLDEARIVRLDTQAHAVVVGNPAIADAIVHDGRNLIITARAFGSTNLIVLDRRGEVVLERMVDVTQPRSTWVTVQRGDALETYSCAPNCRRTPVPGDTAAFFDEIVKQNQTRNGLVQSQVGR
jgi:hypothetical protein